MVVRSDKGRSFRHRALPDGGLLLLILLFQIVLSQEVYEGYVLYTPQGGGGGGGGGGMIEL